MYADSHAHPYDLYRETGKPPDLPDGARVCASAHDREEFLWQEEWARSNPGRAYLSFGIHPQKPETTEFSFLEELVRSGRIDAIGECGFDLFTDEFRVSERDQAAVWDLQVELALGSSLPLVIHARKALHLLFADVKRLKKARAVVFHGWPGSATEAESFLKRGVNAWFGAGKGLLRHDRSLAETVVKLPESRILSETDAPYMRGKDESFSVLSDIRAVAAEIARLRETDETEVREFLFRSFTAVFGENPVSGPAR